MTGQVDERGHVRIGFNEHAAAGAAVAAVGSALLDVLLSPEADAAVAAATGAYEDFCFIDKEHDRAPRHFALTDSQECSDPGSGGGMPARDSIPPELD